MKQYKTPIMKIVEFSAECVVTESSVESTNVSKMQIQMESEGYTVTTADIFNMVF